METDWNEEIQKVRDRESENAEYAVTQEYEEQLNLNYVGQWEVDGFTSSQGTKFNHGELWEFCTRYKYMQRLANLPDKDGNCLLAYNASKYDKCLELGCDWGHNFSVLESCFEEVYGVEITASMIPIAESKGYNVIGCMMENTPFEDNMFDLVTSNQTLEHSLSADIIVKEIYRVTKPGGYSMHTIPCWKSMFVEEESIIHKTNHNYLQWIEKFKENGFEIINHFWGWNHNMEDWTIIVRKRIQNDR